MIEVVLGDGERADQAIKSFRRKVQRSGILKDLRAKRFYLKPSAAKKLKAAAALRRRRSAARRQATWRDGKR
jgi:small subunit ribosomal protein S21